MKQISKEYVIQIEPRKIEEDYTKEELFVGQDKPVKTTKQMGILHRVVGAITSENHLNEIVLGTGVLISSDIVLTCAHNIYCKDQKQIHKNVRFYLGVNGPLEQYFTISEFYIPSQYEKQRQPNKICYDYAILKLTENTIIQQFIPISEFKNFTDIFNAKYFKEVAIVGYSGKDLKTSNPKDRYKMILYQREFLKDSNFLQLRPLSDEIIHFFWTVSGQSGSPIVVIDNNNNMAIIGLHQGGKVENGKKMNYGVAFTGKTIEKVNKQVQQMRSKQLEKLKKIVNNMKIQQTTSKTKQQTTKEQDRHYDSHSIDPDKISNIVKNLKKQQEN